MKVPPIVPAEEKFLDSLKETFNPLSNAYDSSSSYFEEPQLHEVNSDDNGDDLYNMTDLFNFSIYKHAYSKTYTL
ncbi:hypothetical protein QE152_g21993 [Popillia japonica]|uniref:Uncharacterized protein n=1 Tax=Popillia japonica TaxID=7064 RepID=A0AAW1KLV3_POPJA